MTPPPRRRISNIAKLLPKKHPKSFTPSPVQRRVLRTPRTCDSLPPNIGLPSYRSKEDRFARRFARNRAGENSIFGTPHQLPVEGEGEPLSEEVLPDEQVVSNDMDEGGDILAGLEVDSLDGNIPMRETDDVDKENVVSQSRSKSVDAEQENYPSSSSKAPPIACDCSDITASEVRRLHDAMFRMREEQDIRYAALTETSLQTLRLAETLEAQLYGLQFVYEARPSERLFWMIVDGLSAFLLFIISAIMKPWTWVRSSFRREKERVLRRKSWRLSVADFDDSFFGEAGKRISFSTRPLEED